MEKLFAAPQINTLSSRRVITSDKVFHACCWLYLIAFAILPDWFGFYFIMRFSAKRLMMIICFIMIIFSKKRLNCFFQMIKKITVHVCNTVHMSIS